MTTDPFTEAAQDEAAKRWPHSPHQHETHVMNFGKRVGFDLGASWARHHITAQEQDIAQIIDDHRVGSRFVGFGVTITCMCGESVRGEVPVGPQTDEDNAHRDAERKHAEHVADMLARRDEEKR